MYLAISSTEGLPLLEGVPLALLGDGKEPDPPPPPPPPAAAARLVGVDFGDPTTRRGEALVVLLARVDTGDPAGEACARAALCLDGDGDGDGSADALALDADVDAADRLPDRGVDGAGLEAAPRFTGVRRGDAGGFMGDDAADVPRNDDDDDGDGCGAFLAAAARRVAGRARGDGDGDGGDARGAPPLEPPAASRACLMCLNCRLISAA